MVDNSTAIEMLMQIKHLMAENHEEYHAEIGQVRQESNDLKQRVKEIEFQTSDVRTHLVDFETRFIYNSRKWYGKIRQNFLEVSVGVTIF